MLTAEQVKVRDGKLTASRVGVLMSGDEAKVLSLWREMLGLEEPADLSGLWAVRLGEITEQLNLDWYEYKTGHTIHNRGKVVLGNPDWMACTLDGLVEDLGGYFFPIECKHVGGREPLETIIARYQPQMHWQMMCTGAKQCALSVIQGAAEPVVEYIPFNEEYAKELMLRAEAFMLCVASLTPPVAVPAAEPPALPTVEYDMSTYDEWRTLAGRWLQSYGAAVTAKTTEMLIKDMVPRDAKKAYGAGIVVTRNRAGAMSLRELQK